MQPQKTQRKIVCRHDYIDKHCFYIIEDKNNKCWLEGMRDRRTYKWQWSIMEKYLRRAGFCEFTAEEFIADNGKKFQSIIAKRD